MSLHSAELRGKEPSSQLIILEQHFHVTTFQVVSHYIHPLERRSGFEDFIDGLLQKWNRLPRE